MASMELTKDGSVFVLTLTNGHGANTFTKDVLEEYLEVFDRIEATKENASLVITSNSSKFWCTGINLDWLREQPREYFMEFAKLMDRVYFRAALLNLPTIGCLTGHTFAGGAILSAALDFRFMREDRGWFCLPEVDIRIPFTLLMQEVVETLPNRRAVKDLILTGARIGGKEAADLGIVDGAFSEAELFPKTMDFARKMAEKDRETYTKIKHNWRRRIAALRDVVMGGK